MRVRFICTGKKPVDSTVFFNPVSEFEELAVRALDKWSRILSEFVSEIDDADQSDASFLAALLLVRLRTMQPWARLIEQDQLQGASVG